MTKQNQHELPELYLRAFCDQAHDGHVWVFTRSEPYAPSLKRGKGNPFRSGIRQTTASRNRYAGRLFDGTFDVEHWEKQLQKREHAMDGVLARVRAREGMDETEKQLFVDYLITMWLRVSKRWEAAEKRARTHVGGADFDQLARALVDLGRFTDARSIYAAKAFLSSDAGIKHLLLESMLADMKLCRGALLEMTWNFVSAPTGTFFITCDAPFMFDEMLGLAASHVLFPVSPDIMLIAGRDDRVRTPYEVVSEDEALKVNSLTWASAHQAVFAPAPEKCVYDMWRYGVTFDHRGGRINQPT